MEAIDFDLRGDHIALAALLKASGLANSGGAAKSLLLEGGVRVNGEAEARRGRKIRAGDEVSSGERRVQVRAARATEPGEKVDPDAEPQAHPAPDPLGL